MDPEALVGSHVRVYWPVDDAWYKGSVAAYDPEGEKHRVRRALLTLDMKATKRELPLCLLLPGNRCLIPRTHCQAARSALLTHYSFAFY